MHSLDHASLWILEITEHALGRRVYLLLLQEIASLAPCIRLSYWRYPSFHLGASELSQAFWVIVLRQKTGWRIIS